MVSCFTVLREGGQGFSWFLHFFLSFYSDFTAFSWIEWGLNGVITGWQWGFGRARGRTNNPVQICEPPRTVRQWTAWAGPTTAQCLPVAASSAVVSDGEQSARRRGHHGTIRKYRQKKRYGKERRKATKKPPPPRADEKRHSFVHSFVSPNFSVPSSLFFRFSSFVVRQESPTRSTSLSVNVWMCASFLLFFLGPDKTSLLSVSIRGVQNEFFGLFSLSLSLSLLMRRLFGPRFSPPVSRCLPSSETRNSLPEHCRGNCDRIAYKIAFPFFFVLGRFGRLATGLPSFTGFFWQRIP